MELRKEKEAWELPVSLSPSGKYKQGKVEEKARDISNG
jgi:hypothetical protein